MNINLGSFNFTPEQSLQALEKIIQFEYTKLEMELDSKERLENLKLEQEYKLAKIEYEYKYRALERDSKKESSNRILSNKKSNSNFSEEDQEINNLTGFNNLQDKHIGKIAKTNLQAAVKIKAQEIESQITQNEIKKLSPNDCSSSKIKSLIFYLLLGSMVSIRLSKWQDAPDSDMVLSIKSDLKNKLSEYNFKSIICITEYLKKYLKEKYDETPIENLDTTLFGDILDDAYVKQELELVCEEDFDINNSPFGKALNKTISHLDEALRRDLIKMYLETSPNKGLDHMSGVVTIYSEKYPIPAFEKEYGNNWSEFYKKNKSRIDSWFFSNFLRDYNSVKEEHLEWLEEKNKFLEELEEI